MVLPLPLLFREKELSRDASWSPARESTYEQPPGKPMVVLVFWILLMAIFLEVGLETSFTPWMPVFLTRVRSISAAMASYSVSIFWLSVLCGRVLFIRFLLKANLPRALLGGVAAGTV